MRILKGDLSRDHFGDGFLLRAQCTTGGMHFVFWGSSLGRCGLREGWAGGVLVCNFVSG